ncbi:hypothetical protein ES711_09060 [Gelidibacter salicanalis]|uniref:Lipoprotein n=1 Tax=Gelidibacter salicanalis TaxID=291193 RepID=A0A5C7AJW5_9FLAO|nr:hypothetical protein [Gelidibacter salicanalis]TXE08637.1 hypothetical protein ES711_09060 [Gelidibacter salicanalis]
MKTNTLLIIFGILMFSACGTKPNKSAAKLTQEIDTYVSEINANSNLKQEITEGALTDMEGFKDIGTFKYTVYFDAPSNTLHKIKNVETTAQVVTEIYYFKDGDVVLMDVNSGGATTKFYVHKNKVISGVTSDAPNQKLLLEKANRFQKAFLSEH